MRILDVGARAPTDPFYSIENAEIIGFEPDAIEAERVGLLGRAKIVPCALGSSLERRLFYVTHDPQCSSLYRPNDAVIDAFHGLEGARLSHTITVETRPLDDALTETGWSSVDFIKIDVQGAALDVLKGAGRTLSTCHSLLVEIEFVPIYVGEPLFAEVDAFLASTGFALSHFSSLHRRQSHDGVEHTLWGDALYLSRPSELWSRLYPPMHPNPARSDARLQRMSDWASRIRSKLRTSIWNWRSTRVAKAMDTKDADAEFRSQQYLRHNDCRLRHLESLKLDRKSVV